MNAFTTYRILCDAVAVEVRRLCRLLQPSMPRAGRATMETLDRRVLMSAVHGTIFNDLNANGTEDSGEAGLSGVTVYQDANANGHYDSGEPHTTTADDGSYDLEGLPAGDDLVAAVTPSGKEDSTGEQIISFSDDTSVVTNVDFGQVPVLAGPIDFTATPFGPAEIDLSWENLAPNATGLELSRSTNGGAFTLLASLDASTTSYADTYLTDGVTYAYELSVAGPNGPATAGPVSQHLDLAAPTVLSITANTDNYVDLEWVNNSTQSGVDFVVAVKTNGGSYVTAGETSGTTFEDTSITDGNTYTFSVHATDSTENSSDSNTATLSLPLSAASDLSATAVSSNEVDLSWTNNSYANPSFQIERRAYGDGAYSLIATTSAGATSYADTSAAGNTNYSYQVVATAGSATSDPSSSASATTAPAAPYNLSISADSAGGITLNWTNADSAVAVEIDRITGGVATVVATVGAGATSFYDSGLSEATQYSYQVCAVGSAANSSYAQSNSVYTAPAIPGDVVASAAGSNEIDLSWTNMSSANPSFVVMRLKDGDSNFSIVATIGSGTYSFADTGVADSTGYTYEVCAVNEGVTSDPSSTAYAVTPPP